MKGARIFAIFAMLMCVYFASYFISTESWLAAIFQFMLAFINGISFVNTFDDVV